MGWLKRLFGDKQGADDNPMAAFRRARETYYTYVHARLPRLYFTRPDLLTKYAIELNGDNLRRFWRESASACGDENALVVAESLTMEKVEIERHEVLLITLPIPEAPTEAYYAALTVVTEESGEGARYVLLERTFDGQGALCEWFADGRRLNHNEYIAPDMATFRASLARALARPL